MKLFRFGPLGAEKAGIVADDGSLRDASLVVADVSVDTMEALRGVDPMSLPKVPEGVRIGACLAGAPNFFCIGLNYRKHATEFGSPFPETPIMFSKATSCLQGRRTICICLKGLTKPIGKWSLAW
jgi:2-keto-4-pentenoate hydratase/2-oxohepta-3-ene-1,7-dioic acid hydratase in catechol pathway